MKNNKLYMLLPAMLLIFAGMFTSCDKDEYERIQYIKKTNGPFIVGEKYDFAFTVASNDGSVLKNMEVEATYAGAAGTTLDNKCYWTESGGKEGSVEMLTGVATSGKVTNADIVGNKLEYDGGYTSYAITARYAYVVPEEARGKNVRLTVRWTTQNGSRSEYSTDTYDVSNMDMVLNVVLADPTNNSGARYFSIADMKAYTLAEVNAASKSASIDFVYRYNTAAITTTGGTNVVLSHAVIAPSHAIYLNADYVPDTWTKNNTWIEVRKWDDMQLKGSVPNSYITDSDLQQAVMSGKNTAEYGLAANFGTLIQTADGTYRAYVYVKSVNNSGRSMTVGVKRLKVK